MNVMEYIDKIVNCASVLNFEENKQTLMHNIFIGLDPRIDKNCEMDRRVVSNHTWDNCNATKLYGIKTRIW